MRCDPAELLVFPGASRIILDEADELTFGLLDFDPACHQPHDPIDHSALKPQKLDDVVLEGRCDPFRELLAGEWDNAEGGILGRAGAEIEVEKIGPRRFLELPADTYRGRPVEGRRDARR